MLKLGQNEASGKWYSRQLNALHPLRPVSCPHTLRITAATYGDQQWCPKGPSEPPEATQSRGLASPILERL